MTLNPKDNFNSRIINLESFLTGKPNKRVKKVAELLDSGKEEEKDEIRTINEHWILFLFECHGEVNGALVVSKDTSSYKAEKLSNIVTKYLERSVPTTTKSDKNCEDTIETFFPKIFDNNIICQYYKF